ncbi:MAG: TetR/AcrR family transcriptional regulator [Cellulomonas sp.]|nr:TetR/AcrR family transcriptional regulator [Cellulomonas sp.]
MLHLVQQVDASVDAPEQDERPTLAELASALGLRERKKRARREQLIDATHRLVERDGLDAVTVEAICEAAGVSVRTFFNYFESKDDAVLGHTPWPLASEAADVFAAGGPTGHLLPDLEHLVTAVLDDPPMGRSRLARALELASREPRLLAKHLAWMEQHKGQLVELVERRLGDEPGHSPDVVAAFALFLTHVTFMRWDAAGGQGRAPDHVASVVRELRSLLTD